MNITINHILVTLTIIIALIAGNVYQYGNPQVVEVPAGQTAIDSTVWVKRSAYATRGLIIDSLSAQNKKLAGRVRQSKDRIANYTAVTGRLRLTIDSLQSRPPVRLDSLLGLTNNPPPSYSDTSVAFQQPFADSLFSVQSQVTFK